MYIQVICIPFLASTLLLCHVWMSYLLSLFFINNQCMSKQKTHVFITAQDSTMPMLCTEWGNLLLLIPGTLILLPCVHFFSLSFFLSAHYLVSHSQCSRHVSFLLNYVLLRPTHPLPSRSHCSAACASPSCRATSTAARWGGCTRTPRCLSSKTTVSGHRCACVCGWLVGWLVCMCSHAFVNRGWRKMGGGFTP